ncbi:MAG: hypothetical protein ABJF10_21030 [Chthoniobacter sp.]|uniref:DUF7694 domain-containing protein n=1 Tax=Chthoniobacter sp. TaxID=2510640 RepID=UPI0032A90EC6
MNTVTSAVIPLDRHTPPPRSLAKGDREMTPFVERPHDVRENQIYRDALLAQPPDFFKGYCQGRVPDIFERMVLVERLVQAMAAPQVFVNDTYRVQVRREPPIVQLTISRHDGEPAKDWRQFQQIKNELVGPEFEAVELFPAESRLVDMDNEYHLWVNTETGFRFPFGYARRHVAEKPIIYRGRAGQEVPDSEGAPLLTDSTAGALP